MKMVKKILFGLVAVAAVLSLASCGIKKDDPEGIIKGTAGNYSVNYKYENADTTATYRAYKPTGFKHAGELAKITFDKNDISKAGNSKFGVIFGLKEDKQGNTTYKNFFIVGLGANGDYYVSKFENVVDIQAENFGAGKTYTNHVSSTGSNGEKETLIPNANDQYGSNGILSGSLYGQSNEDKYAYIWYQVFKDGSIKVIIGNIDENSSEYTTWKNKTDYDRVNIAPPFTDTLDTFIISQTQTGYTAWAPNDSNHSQINAPQDYVAIYARVQGNSTLNGKVKFVKDFCEAEDIEPID